MTDNRPTDSRPSPPSRHQLAVMIWLAVFPTLTVLNLLLGHWLHTLGTIQRTFVLATVAVPIVMYGVMPPCTAHAPRSSLAPEALRRITT